MSTTPTAVATAKNKAGEDVTIEIPIPTANSAAEWNAAMQEGYAKAGVEVPGAAATTAATTETKKDGDQATLYRASFTVNGKEMVFEDPDPAKVLSQYTSAVEAAQLAATPAAAATTTQATTEQKPALSAADMFDIGTKLIGGDATGLDTLLEKSGAFDRYLEKQGISIDKLKAASEKTQSDTVHDAWKTATDGFLDKVKSGEVDYPGGQANYKMMGYTLARLNLKPTTENMIKAWETMKTEGMVFPVEKPTTQQTTTAATTAATTTQTTQQKTAPSSTAIGTSGGDRTSTQQQTGARPKIELDMTTMTPHNFMTAYNEAINQGYKENVDLFVKR